MIVAIDTETDILHRPFVATSTDEQLNSRLYRLNKEKEYALLKQVCEDKSITKLCHPVTFDAYAVWTKGITMRGPKEDTMIAASLINENFESKKLKELARVYLGEKTEEARELGRAKAKYNRLAKKLGKVFDYSMLPRHILHKYALKDPEYTMKLWYFFKTPLQKYIDLYNFEKSLIAPILEMQKRGVMADRPFAKKMSMKYKHMMVDIEEQMQDEFCKFQIKLPEFNPNSADQIAYVLPKMGVPLRKKTAKGKLVTDAPTLSEYDEHKIVNLILMHRFCMKQKGTYFDPLYNRYTTDSDPFAHFLLWQSGTKTGRFSAELIQTIPRPDESRIVHAPKLARKAFIPRPGYRFISADYKALQMVLFFHFADAKLLIQKVIDGWDPHDATCQLLFGEVNKELRKIAKNIGFGFLFGMGIEKLIRSLKVSAARGQEIMRTYFSYVPVREFMRKTTGDLYRKGYITLEFDSELMSFSREYRVPQELAYKGVNMIIQGTEAYVVKCAIKRVERMIREKGMDCHMITTVHDEILFELGKKEPLKLSCREIKKAMEDHVTFKVPIRVDVSESEENWGNVKKLDLAA